MLTIFLEVRNAQLINNKYIHHEFLESFGIQPMQSEKISLHKYRQ